MSTSISLAEDVKQYAEIRSVGGGDVNSMKIKISEGKTQYVSKCIEIG
jgi:hypothetical protein